MGENAGCRIPYFRYRGTPAGIDVFDVFKVVETGIAPVVDAGLAGRDGAGRIGAGTLRAPLDCFRSAREAYRRHYGFRRPAPGVPEAPTDP